MKQPINLEGGKKKREEKKKKDFLAKGLKPYFLTKNLLTVHGYSIRQKTAVSKDGGTHILCAPLF